MNPNKIWNLKFLTLLVIVLAIALAYSGTLLFPVKAVSDTGIKISFILAFLGGFLALLSPCSAVIIPAFFSYFFQDKNELLKMTYIFFLGLLVIFIPLGFSTSIISFLFSFYREITFSLSGMILMLIGIIKMFNIYLPFVHFSFRETKNATAASVFLTGMFFSFTTIACTGPIIGGIVTMASVFGFSSVMAILLLIVFALGLVTPLFFLSLLFRRYNLSHSWLLRQKRIRIGKELIFLPANVLSGAVFFFIGTTLLFYEKINYSFGDAVSNVYLRVTSLLYRFLIDNQILNIISSAAFIIFIIGVVLIISKSEMNGQY